MFDWIKDFFNEQQQKECDKRHAQLVAEVNAKYNVTERGGNLYVVAGSSVAVKFESTDTVAHVIETLENIRKDQIAYAEKQ